MENTEQPFFFVIEGTIDALSISPGAINLVSDIQRGSSFTGVMASSIGEAGLSSALASLTLYDGENVEHIALLIDGRLVVGTFEWLRDLNVGDNVKLVVSETHEGPLFTHAILREHDQLLWTPYSVSRTRWGWTVHAIKLGLFGLVGTWLIIGSCYLFGHRPNATSMAYLFASSVAMIAFVMFMSTRGVMHLGDQAEDIFRLLNVPRFDRFIIRPFSLLRGDLQSDPHIFRKRHIFRFADALIAHKKKFNLQ